MGLGGLLEKLGLRKPKRIIKTPKFNAAEISDLIRSLENEPSMQCAVIERRACDISFSKDEKLIDTAIRILADNSHYEGMHSFWYDEAGRKRLMQLSPQKRNEFASYLIDRHKECYVEIVMEVGRGVMGVPEKEKLKEVVSGMNFRSSNPITAVKSAVMTGNYDFVGLIFAFLRKESAYWSSSNENYETKKFRANQIDVKRYQSLPKLMHDAESSGSKEEAKVLREEADSLHKKLDEGYDALLEGMEDQKKAFEAVGEALLRYKENVNGEMREGDYRLAMEYLIKSGNAVKILKTAKKANTIERKDIYYNRDVRKAAFDGFKALLTDLSRSSDMTPEIKEEAMKGLKEAFMPEWAYREFPGLAIEAAVLTGDFTALRDNFYRIVERGYKADPEVYEFLKSMQAVDDSKIIEMINDYLKKELEGKDGSRFNPPRIRDAIKTANLVSGMGIDRELLHQAIAAGPGSSEMTAGFEYLEKRGMLTSGERRVYGMVQEGRL